MGSKYPVLPPEKVIKVLMKFGFNKVSQRVATSSIKKTDNLQE